MAPLSAPHLLERLEVGLQRLERRHAFLLVLDDVPLDAATVSAAVMMAGQSSSSAPRYAFGSFFENGFTCIEIVRPALRWMSYCGVTPCISDALPVSNCSTTSFAV